jgi:hypothetical protein
MFHGHTHLGHIAVEAADYGTEEITLPDIPTGQLLQRISDGMPAIARSWPESLTAERARRGSPSPCAPCKSAATRKIIWGETYFQRQTGNAAAHRRKLCNTCR